MKCQVCGGNHSSSIHTNGMGEVADPFMTDEYLTDPYQTGEDYDHPEVENSESVQYAQTEDQAFKDPQVLQAEMEAGNITELYPEQAQDVTQMVTGKAQGIAQDLMTLAQAASEGDAQTILSAVEKFSKSQLVRFLDISIIGPMLLVWAYRGRLSKMERLLMGLIGAGTVIYNGKHYLQNKKIVQPKQIAQIKDELKTTMMSGRY